MLAVHLIEAEARNRKDTTTSSSQMPQFSNALTMSQSPSRPSSSLSLHHRHPPKSSSSTPGLLHISPKGSPKRTGARNRQTAQPSPMAVTGEAVSPKPRKQRKNTEAVTIVPTEERPTMEAKKGRGRAKGAEEVPITTTSADVFTADQPAVIISPRKTRNQRAKAQPAPMGAAPSPPAPTDEAGQTPTQSAPRAKKTGRGKRGNGRGKGEQRKRSNGASSADEGASPSSIDDAGQGGLPAPIPISVTPNSPSVGAAGALLTTPTRTNYVPLDETYLPHSAPSGSPFLTSRSRPRHARSKSNINPSPAVTRPHSDFSDADDAWDMPIAGPRSVGTSAPPDKGGLTWQQQAALAGSASNTRTRSLRSRGASETTAGAAGAPGFATPPRRTPRQTSTQPASNGRKSVPLTFPAPANDAALTWQQTFLQRTSPAPPVSTRDAAAFDAFGSTPAAPAAGQQRFVGPASAPNSPAHGIPPRTAANSSARGNKRSTGVEANFNKLSLGATAAPSSAKKSEAYAGPQFHNSPSAAALPPPKFFSALTATASAPAV